MIKKTRRRNGIEALPSQTNFGYANIGQNAGGFAKKMAKHNVLIHDHYDGCENFSQDRMGKIEVLEIFSDVFHTVYRS